MFLSELKKSNRIKLNLISKIFPIRNVNILLIDKIEIDLKLASINEIEVPPIFSPQINPDFCLKKSDSYVVNSFISNKKISIEDFTGLINENFSYSETASFRVEIDKPKTEGKVYRQSRNESKQQILFTDNDNCIHGLKKNCCYLCTDRERKKREFTSKIDSFDIVFPILYPPLGDNFDNPILFPPGMEPYPFQINGIKFLVENERALLGDEMGLGKSIQAIVAIRFLFRMGKIKNALIICPKSVLIDWEKKLWDWAPEIRVIKIHGESHQRQILWNTKAHIYLTTYETLRTDFEEKIINNKEFNLIVLDEIQKIKNPDAEITKTVRKINSPLRWGLSGTPLENRLEELISIFEYLKPGLLDKNSQLTIGEIKETIKPYFLRRRKKDVLPDLPEKIYEQVWLELTPEQRKAYEEAEKKGIIKLNEEKDQITVQHILALITRLKQICNLDPQSGKSCKADFILEKLEEMSEQDNRAIIFSQYPKKTLKYLESRLKNFKPLLFDGSLSDSKRNEIIQRFQENSENKVILMSVRAGGLGLTLTEANYVFHFDLWWNPSVASQAEDRAHRIGQKKPVFVTTLFTVNTIEERIHDILEKKQELFKEVIEDLSETNLSKVLTEEELFSLFGIQKPKKEKSTSEGLTLESLKKLSAEEFEKLIATLYEKMGYNVRTTPKTKDEGIDIFAKRESQAGTEYLAIQCKHYPNGVVNVQHVRELFGVISAKQNITKGVLITSGRFSKGCKEFANSKRIELFDGEYLAGLLKKYDLSFYNYEQT